MYTKFVIPGICLFIVAAVVASFISTTRSMQPTTTPIRVPYPTFLPARVPQTTMWLEGNSITTKERWIPISIFMNTKENKVSALHIAVSFDPKVLSCISVKPVNQLAGKKVTMEYVNNTEGKILFEIANDAKDALPIQGYDKIFELTFTSLVGEGKSTTITLLPYTSVTAQDIPGSALVGTKDTTLITK